jgi:hypothetical protein
METEKKSYFTTFNNNIIYTFLYFILLITVIIIIFSSTYITISLLVTLFFVYLFISQLYNFFISKERNYFSIIFSSFIIAVLLFINFIIPNDNSILESINNPNMNGTIIIIIYATVIYSLLFIFSLAYSTYKQNKNILYWISIAFIILYVIYIVYFSYISSPSSILINILIYIPFYSSIFFILYYLLDSSNIIDNSPFLNDTSFQQLLENPNYNSPDDKQDDITHRVSKFLLLIYLIVYFICFILFLSSTSNIINKCDLSEYIFYIINSLLVLMLFSIVITMTNVGLGIKSNSNITLQILTISCLVIYNIFISKHANDSCYGFIKSNASLVITIIYIITFYMYYKLIYNNSKIGEDLNLLIYFVILIVLFIIVIISINNSKLSLESYLNNINIYIYTIIGYVCVCMVGFIFIYFIKHFSLDNIFQINKENFIENMNYAFYVIIGIFILFSIINWISELSRSIYLNSSLNATSIIINLCIIIVSMAILFKLISYTSFYQTNPLLQLVIGSVFYIPCLLISVLDFINGYKKNITNNFELKNFQINKTDIILFIFIVILYIIYFNYPLIYTNISTQDGKLLLKEPISLNNEKLLATHQFLSIKDNINVHKHPDKEIHPYNYALSFWIFIDSNSFINSKNKYYSILNYGNNPNIQYRGNDNTFIVSLKNKNKQENGPLYQDKYELDDDNNVIIYKTNNLLLQKWNNIIINYDGSILDIFINGKLEKSFKEIIPYMKNDNITIGSENGIHGGICNVIYFDKNLSLEKIGYIYNSVKMLNPPILLNYYDRLYTSSLQIENVTYDIGLKQVDINKKLDYVK